MYVVKKMNRGVVVKMSWFKRTSSVRDDGRVAVNGRGSPGRDRTNTDPDTCFEVFKNHWQQASNVINATSKKNGSSSDDVETVVHNFEQMVTLLVGEEGIDGMPGPIAHFLLEKDVFETFCNWCSSQRQHQDKLCMEQLRMYELLISQSRQLLLIHRPVIRPLLRLLMACAEPQLPNSGSEELEFRLVLVLHQICTCISQETVILESFFSTEADHGPAKFLIFSLLIPYIHREGPIGQRARDALLLLMTLSARHPHIGHYIAENSDFCPVLATGLSGLYSSLPRKITPPSDDWFALTEDDCQRIVDLQMFLNSLEFCNAVVQVAHPLVRDQLIKFIYTGFLLPVLGPALHQNSRDEVMTATAYLDLFLRRISEPHLIRAFLRFVLTERHDEMMILESLITRINSNTKLSLISLSLFHTLIDLNCQRPTLTALRYSNAPPNTGPFLSAVFQRLEGMVQNSLYANLLLTGLVTRLATYPQPLLRSFLLNVNLVFQPTVKSLVQVLSSVRQKVDSYAVTTRNFGVFMTKARRNLKLREDFLVSSMTGVPSPHLPNIDCLPGQMTKPRAATVSDIPAEKKKMSLTDLLFRRSPRQRQNPGSAGRKGQHLQRVEVAGGVGYRFINSIQQDTPENPEESIKTWNAVYCALVLEEFLKELAALSLEHSVLNSDDVVSIRTKLRIFNSNVKSVLLYGCETWRTTKTMQQKIQTFLNTCLRRIFNIRWPEKIRNEELWERAGQEPVAKQILRRKEIP
nr:hypothetical protein BaRGS_002129 [Batillaria attramentaria]